MIEVTFTFRNEAEKRRWLEALLAGENMSEATSYGWSDPEGQEAWEVGSIEVEPDPQGAPITKEIGFGPFDGTSGL